MEQKFNNGDVVRLKSGSPSFVVSSEGNYETTVWVNYWNQLSQKVESYEVSTFCIETVPETPSLSI